MVKSHLHANVELLLNNLTGDTGFDMKKFQSEEYQRAFEYLTQLAAGSNMDQFLFIYNSRAAPGGLSDALNIIIQ